MVAIVVGNEERVRSRLHKNLPVQEVRPEDKTVDALMHPGQKLATNLECWSAVGAAVLHSGQGVRDCPSMFKAHSV